MRKSRKVAVPAMIVCTLLVAHPALAELRTWTDVSGKHTTEAEFVSATAEAVMLRKQDGQESRTARKSGSRSRA